MLSCCFFLPVTSGSSSQQTNFLTVPLEMRPEQVSTFAELSGWVELGVEKLGGGESEEFSPEVFPRG